MEVIEAKSMEGITAAVIKGFPADLNWYEEGRERGDYLLVRTANRLYLLTSASQEQALETLRELPANAESNLAGGDPLLEFPPAPGRGWGGDEPYERTDNRYRWFVERQDRMVVSIKGVRIRKPQVRYRVAFRTNPDHQIVDYVQGIGIIRYIYMHHGTVAETDVHLVEFHRGRP
jgi:hypothetical protein